MSAVNIIIIYINSNIDIYYSNSMVFTYGGSSTIKKSSGRNVFKSSGNVSASVVNLQRIASHCDGVIQLWNEG